MDTDTTYRDAVARGAAFLDEQVGPDWPSFIDLDTFSITSCYSCVLGQLFGVEGEMTRRLGLTPSYQEPYTTGKDALNLSVADEVNQYTLGFDVPYEVSDVDTAWQGLQYAWRALIKARQEADA